MIEPLNLMLPNRLRNFEDAFRRWETIAIEPKIDGMIIQAHINDNDVKIFSRTGKPLNSFPILFDAIRESCINSRAVLDGELVLVKNNKIASFEMLMRSYKNGKLPGGVSPAIIFFDLIDFDGNEAFTMPFSQRKTFLQNFVASGKHISITPASIVNNEREAETIYRDILKSGFEGIVLKNCDAPYTFGRSNDILKMKPIDFMDFKIVEKGQYGTGGFQYIMSDDKIVCKVRDHRNFKVGAFVEVAFEAKFSSGKLKFPRIIREREEK